MPDPSKTEKPTGKRLSDARKKGQLAYSREIPSAIVLLAGMMLLAGPGRTMFDHLQEILSYSIISISYDSLSEATTVPSLKNRIGAYAWDILPQLAIILFGLLAAGSLGTLVQTRMNWANKKVGLDFSKVKLNPMAFFQRIFSQAGAVEFLKSILKMAVIGIVAYIYLKNHAQELLSLAAMGLPYSFFFWAGLAYNLGINVAIVYLILAILDYIYQRYDFMNNMKMTKAEVKDERVQAEGNPIIRRALRGKQRQMAMMRMMAQVPEATVVITNPIHLAIAIKYTPDMLAPKVLAKGSRLVAERIVNMAKENEIPVVENIPLARALYSTVEIDQDIPPELYTAMAEVLVYIFRLRGSLNSLVS